MGCVYATYLRLTNSSFCLIWARMNHFEAHAVVLSQKVDSRVFRMAILMRRSKMATSGFEILDGFSLV